MDAAQFKSQVLPLGRRLLHFAHMLLRDAGEAQDAVQEVYLRLWKIRDSLENYNSLEAFALKVTRNWCLDRLKARKPVYIENYSNGYDRSTDEISPYLLLENRDKAGILDSLMEKLPEQQRIILQLRDLEGLEFEQIAEVMEMSLNAIRVNLSRARTRLKEEFLKFETHENRTTKNNSGKVL
jgi:RNA polymerase sigma-70 factor (ECF subfamily)